MKEIKNKVNGNSLEDTPQLSVNPDGGQVDVGQIADYIQVAEGRVFSYEPMKLAIA